jgi:hypothetical protein
VVLLGAALWGPTVSNVEQPKYQITESSGSIEIRDYPPMIVAEAEVSGDRRCHWQGLPCHRRLHLWE